MGIAYQYCSNCFTPFLPGTRYCTNCGQAVDPVLVAELQWLYRSLKDLDARIAAGEGDSTITQLRDHYREEYLAQRQGEVRERPAPAPQEPVPEWPAAPAPSPAGAYIARARAASGATGAPQQAPPATPAEPRPIFSWREFVQEQAIAIMAYLGGFLLLVATLSFEVGAWQFLTNGVKLFVVSAVYIVFGILGFAMRQAERLRTVGRAYLGVFALMTPLVCLAVYRFALQPLNFSGYAMLSLSSFYAAVVYLALAWRTRFATYGYLGWVALLVGALAIIPWQSLPWDWWTFTVALVALVMLIPREFRRVEAASPLAAVAIVADSGTQLAGVATAATIIGVELQGLMIWGTAIGATEPGGPPLRSAFALAACALSLLAAMWGLTLRRLNQQVERGYLDLADWSVVAFGAQAGVAVAAWAQADRSAMTYLLAALAVAQVAIMAGLKWLATERSGLRLSVGGLGLGLAIIGIFIVIGGPLPNWPLVAALSAGGLVALSLTVLERQPAFIVIGGTFFSFAYHITVVTFYPDIDHFGLPHPLPHPAVALYEAGFALGIWLVSLGIGTRRSWGPYAGLTYLVATGNALYAAFLILFYPGHDLTTQTGVLVAFVAAALIAGLHERALDLGSIAFGLFGLLAVIPTTIRAENALTIGATVIIAWLLTIAIRRVIGRAWMIAAYVVALWTTALANLHLTIEPPTATLGWSLFGIPFMVWLLLASAIPASIAAIEENSAPLTIFPALMGLGAVLETTDHVAPAVLVFVLIAAAMILRQLRDVTWSVAWYVSAILASIFAANALGGLGSNGPYWQTIFTLALAAAAYAVAAVERQWLISLAAVPYVIAALALLPASNDFIPTLIITFGTVALGIALRLAPVAPARFRAEWSLGLYSSAVAGSIFAIVRVTPFDSSHVEAWLLIFAAVAYIAAIIERQPLAGIAPAVYAFAAVVAQPDAHALLPLSLVLAMLGLVAGRVAGRRGRATRSGAGGWRWSWPLYTVAAIAAAATVGHSQGDLVFAAQALAIIAVATYLVAALEARPDVLVGALIVGAAALGETAAALRWPAWQGVLAFAALSWGYMLLHWFWRVLPWLRPGGGAWWTAFAGGTRSSGGTGPSGGSVDPARLNDPRTAGVEVHRLGSLLLALGTVIAAMIGADTFTPFNIATEMVVVALASFAALLALQALLSPGWYALWYFAGGAVALAISWQARWFGADNVQAYILAPGSYQLVIGALLPADRRLGQPNWAGQLFSLTGALTLMVPTLAQSFQPDQDWIYAIVLAGEALLVAGVGVGTRSRALVAVGLGFVGLAAIRGSILAVNSGVPVAVVIGIIALLLMGAATWLSLRLRRDAGGSAGG